jgi:Cu/Ag efflux protein CusF
MKSLITPVLVVLAAAVFSAHSIAATDHDAHGGHDAMPAPTAAEVSTVKKPVKTINKTADKVTASQGVTPNSKINANRSGPASSDGHAHEHTDAK